MTIFCNASAYTIIFSERLTGIAEKVTTVTEKRTVEEIDAEIKALQNERDSQYKQERRDALEDVRAKVKKYYITKTELRNALYAPRKSSTTTKSKKSSGKSNDSGEAEKN